MVIEPVHCAQSLKSVWVVLAQTLGPFGPPKKLVNFDMFQKHQKCVLCILTPNHLTKVNYCCPTVLNSTNKAEIGPLSFLCYQVFWSSQMYLVLWARRSRWLISRTELIMIPGSYCTSALPILGNGYPNHEISERQHWSRSQQDIHGLEGFGRGVGSLWKGWRQ